MEIIFMALIFLFIGLVYMSLSDRDMPFIFSGLAGILSLIIAAIANVFIISLFFIFVGFAMIGKSIVDVTKYMD